MSTKKCAEEYANEQEITAIKVLKVIGYVILGIAFVILFGFVVMWLWNKLMPDLFNLKELNYWQSMGILILGRVLFGGFGGGSSSNKDDKKSVKGVIANEIHKEMQKEFKKEFHNKYPDTDNNEYPKTNNHEKNTEQEDLYEKWWVAEGEKKFEDYLDRND